MVDALTALARPWAELYRATDLLQFGVHALHLGGIAYGAAAALDGDARVLRLRESPMERQLAVLEELGRRHGRVLLALTGVVLSGFLLLLAQLQTMLPSLAFWLKMAGFAVLLWNGDRLRRIAGRLHAAGAVEATEWKRLERCAGRSVVLWTSLTLVGLYLTTLR